MITRTEPWITEDANKLLAQIVNEKQNISVFEFGMGASTLWFSKQKNITSLVSVEHDEKWYKQIKKDRKTVYPNRCLIKSPLPYNDAIDLFGEFDIIFVDGRNRSKCIENSITHLKQDGVLILDNSEREYYNNGVEKLLKSGIKKIIKTTQPHPDKYGFTYPGWETAFYFK